MTRAARLTAIITASAALAACGTVSAATAAAGSTPAATTQTSYAFDINNPPADPGFIPVPGTNPKVLSQGDELIINDQLTSTHRTAGGYPIVGYDAGTCTITRAPEMNAEQTLADCVVTAVWKDASLTVEGVVPFMSQKPESAQLAITGGTGRLDRAAGTVSVSFTRNYKILIFTLK